MEFSRPFELSQVLTLDPLPSHDTIFNIVQQKDTHKWVMMGRDYRPKNMVAFAVKEYSTVEERTTCKRALQKVLSWGVKLLWANWLSTELGELRTRSSKSQRTSQSWRPRSRWTGPSHWAWDNQRSPSPTRCTSKLQQSKSGMASSYPRTEFCTNSEVIKPHLETKIWLR